MTAITAPTARRGSTGKPAPVNVARARGDAALVARRAAGDPRAREALIERFLPLARSIARRYESSNEPMEDLVQVASLALVKAVDRYDPSRGHAFSSFAVPTIAGELKRHFRDRTWTVRPPRDLQELTIKVERASNELWQRHDRAPTIAELAVALGQDEEHILEAMHARTARGRLSLDAQRLGDEDQPTLGDALGTVDTGFDQAESRAMLDALLATVSRRDREIIRLRFEEDLTQAEIGELLGLSQMQISRIVRQTLAQLHHVADQQERLVEQRA
ncbi:MAG TPA: SigB/SigF/SigG family RNA polymerase sigma factor [Solirubrobacteraceae bacterium]|jgi:RNA polymerase sigma-B factor|nr:SigB/SigF/SigG family RNA polymerase sigma factor [Solirubrobacteraceae bacterium]